MIVAIVTALLPLFTQSAEAKTDMPAQKKPKIAVFTFSAGFKHSALPLAEETIGKLAKESGAFEADLLGLYRHEPKDVDLSFLDADFLKKYDGLVFYTTSGERDLDLLTETQRTALMTAIKQGTAFIGIHSATDTFYKWPEYGEMIGAYFDGHPWGAGAPPVTIKIEDRYHPATLPLGASWFLQEEIYQFRAPYDRDKLHVLMSLDTKATDMTVEGIHRTDGDFAIAWTKLHGKGRVFHTALGHREEVWRDELFQQHLLGGIRWALGQLPGKPYREGASQPGEVILDSGLRYVDIVAGSGPAAQRTHSVLVRYEGRLEDGTVFDTSHSEDPLMFMLGVSDMIAGFTEGIEGMRVGGKRKLIIPPHLAYGERGSGDEIPPNATLLFEVELLDTRN